MNEVRLDPNGYEYDHYKPLNKALGENIEKFLEKFLSFGDSMDAIEDNKDVLHEVFKTYSYTIQRILVLIMEFASLKGIAQNSSCKEERVKMHEEWKEWLNESSSADDTL